jgi:GDP/UDP-N,N'-diacetylbacillosamine 2-epimerase (hydrolysing)
MKVGTINIGNRQKGRLRAPSVIDCPPDKESIKTALDYIISSEFKTTLSMVENPYYCKDTSARIKDIIKERLYLGIETTKHFYDI